MIEPMNEITDAEAKAKASTLTVQATIDFLNADRLGKTQPTRSMPLPECMRNFFNGLGRGTGNRP